MIGKLTGILENIQHDWVILDVSGVGYCVFVSDRTRSNLPPLGSSLKLFIETHVREDHIRLYGFLSLREKDWFQVLQTVQGVGVKVALGILSSFSHEELTQAVMTENHSLLTRTPGVGLKVAERIVRELKDKIPSFPLTDIGEPLGFSHMEGAHTPGTREKDPLVGHSSLIAETQSALVNLGYSPLQAQVALRRALEQNRLQTPLSLEILIRSSLRYCMGS